MSGLFGTPAPIVNKRRVFFSFHYQNDIWRVNQVRQSWRRQHEAQREALGFYDGSIWETARRTGPESLKALIRDGIANTSVTCVLVGEQTFQRRWVRYELARSIIKGNGLLAVKIHLMGDQQGYASYEGPNPLDYVGVYNDRGSIRLAEKTNAGWVIYQDYTLAVDLPTNWIRPHDTNVIPLSAYGRSYCYRSQNGAANFAAWVRQAAVDAGR